MRVTRRAKLRRSGYTPWHEYQLLTGFDYLNKGYGGHRSVPFGEATARADWAEHRDELLVYWLSDPAAWSPRDGESLFRQTKPGGPGSRPWAWWTFDAPEPRRIVARWTTQGAPFRLVEIAVDAEPVFDILEWPRLWRTDRARHFYRGMRNPLPGIIDFETEREYLERLQLMTDAEWAALPPDDPERADDVLGYADPDDKEATS